MIDAGKGHGSGVLAQPGEPGVDQLQPNRFEVGGVAGGQLSAMGHGGGGDHGIGCGDRPGQTLPPAHQLAIPVGRRPAGRRAMPCRISASFIAVIAMACGSSPLAQAIT